jgi:hypothetical protein
MVLLLPDKDRVDRVESNISNHSQSNLMNPFWMSVLIENRTSKCTWKRIVDNPGNPIGKELPKRGIKCGLSVT